MNREAGFYWVRRTDRWIVAEWFVGAPLQTRGWWCRGDDRSWLDRDFDEIGPKIEPPPTVQAVAAPSPDPDRRNTLVGPSAGTSPGNPLGMVGAPAGTSVGWVSGAGGIIAKGGPIIRD